MQRISVMFLLALAGCIVPDPRYCDNKTRFCEDPLYPYCNVPERECQAAPDGSVPGDMDLGSDGNVGMCQTSASCPGTTPICAAGACRACTTGDDSECAVHDSATPHCGPAGTCVACTTATQATDCLSSTPICSADGSCRKCAANSECASGVCKTEGACASSNEVYYVDNRGSSSIAACKSANPTADGKTSASAFCDVADATGATTVRPYVVVKGSETPYTTPIAWTSTTTAMVAAISILGPGHSAATRAVIQPSVVSPAVALTNVSGTAGMVTIDGLDLVGQGSGSAGVKCSAISGSATLIVRNSYIHNSGGYGVDASNCGLTLDANIVYQNSGGGVSINGGSVDASNNLVVGNGTGGPGVAFAGSVGGTWRFNTVASNSFKTGPTTNPGAFTCSTTGQTLPALQAGIVWGNDKDGTGASFDAARCSFSYTDIDDTTTPTGTGNFKMDPMLTNGTLPATSYRIPSGSPCKDKVTAASGLSGTLPTHDVDGNARPRATTGGYDCGGSQAP